MNEQVVEAVAVVEDRGGVKMLSILSRFLWKSCIMALRRSSPFLEMLSVPSVKGEISFCCYIKMIVIVEHRFSGTCC